MLGSVNKSAFSLDDLYNPRLARIYSIYWDITLVFTTIFFIFMLYVIFKKSTKEMESYKWCLCHQLCWSYLFDLHMSLWKAVPLWPFYVGYNVGIYSNFTGKLAYIPFIAACVFVVGLALSIFISVLHRYIQAVPLSIWFKLYQILWLRACLYIFLFASIGICGAGSIAFFIPDLTLLKNSLIRQNSAFKDLFEMEPSLFGFDPETNNGLSTIFVIACLGTSLGFILILTGMYFNFLRLLRKNKSSLSKSTYKLQLVLFHALSVQIFFLFLLLMGPIALSLGLSLWGFQWLPKFVLFAVSIVATHTLFDFTAIIYYVKVYRMFFINILKKFSLQLYLDSPKIVKIKSTPSTIVRH